MKKGTIVTLCDLTGNMVKPWLDAGYDAVLVDPQHTEGIHTDGAITRIGHVIDHPATWGYLSNLNDVVFTACFPPCTDLAVSGARWFESKREADSAFQFKAMQVVWQCHVIAEMLGAPYFIENPVSQISSLWRKPDHSFHPYDFTGYQPEDNYTKKTCLWVGRGFRMPQPHRNMSLGAPDDRIHKCPPGAERGNIRSATPEGFAIAVFEANKPGGLSICASGKAA
ncbi:hypothetical protein [Cedecea sp. P7760]|uniref:hypothetical protein n=1 Tax=Cedecea sp. P7760 TaxID=2726983 RepID=UPI0015A2BDD6|nr:hypothetical protein [Cedecea sp. P7760]NWC63725.1 hypothetical protein [Cedecea sp. P7760]